MEYSRFNLSLPLAAYYRMDEVSGTTLSDFYSTNDGVYSGSPTLNQTGLLFEDTNTCVDFSGSSQYATTPIIGVTQISFTFLFSSDDGPSVGSDSVAQRIITQYRGTGTVRLTIGIDDGKLSVLYNDGSDHLVNGVTTLVASRTYFGALFFNGSRLTIYMGDTVTGTLSKEVDVTSITTMSAPSTDGINIGGNNSRFFNGKIDEVSIYASLLHFDDAATLFELARAKTHVPDCSFSALVKNNSPTYYWRLGETTGTTATDEMGAAHGTYSGTLTSVTGLLSDDTNSAIEFGAGKTTKIEVSTAATSAYTFVCIIKPSTTTNDYQGIFYRDGLGLYVRNMKLDIYYSATDHFSTATLTAGTTYSIGVTTDTSGNAKLYINGVLDSTHTGAPVNFAATVLCNEPSGSYPLQGIVDEIVVFNRVLTDVQILAIHQWTTRNFTYKNTLVGFGASNYWDMDNPTSPIQDKIGSFNLTVSGLSQSKSLNSADLLAGNSIVSSWGSSITSTGLLLNQADWSLSFVFKRDMGTGPWNCIASSYPEAYYSFYNYTTFYSNNGAISDTIDIDININDSFNGLKEIHHVLITNSGNFGRLYIDGRLQGIFKSGQLIGGLNELFHDPWTANWLIGRFDEIVAWNKVIPHNEAKGLAKSFLGSDPDSPSVFPLSIWRERPCGYFNLQNKRFGTDYVYENIGGSGMDSVGDFKRLTVGNFSSFTESLVPGETGTRSLQFQTADLAKFYQEELGPYDTPNNGTDWSISFLFNAPVFATSLVAASPYTSLLYAINTDNQFYQIRNNTTTVLTTQTFATDTTYFVVITNTASTTKVYINGLEIGTLPGGEARIYSLGYYTTNTFFDELAFYPRTLSATSVSRLYGDLLLGISSNSYFEEINDSNTFTSNENSKLQYLGALVDLFISNSTESIVFPITLSETQTLSETLSPYQSKAEILTEILTMLFNGSLQIINNLLDRYIVNTGLLSKAEHSTQIFDEQIITSIENGMFLVAIAEALSLSGNQISSKKLFNSVIESLVFNILSTTAANQNSQIFDTIKVLFSEVYQNLEQLNDTISVLDSIVSKYTAMMSVIDTAAVSDTNTVVLRVFENVESSATVEDWQTINSILSTIINDNFKTFLSIPTVEKEYETWVINPTNYAVWNYTNFNFDSACTIDGVPYYANSTGLYRGINQTDDSSFITGVFNLPANDMGTSSIKQVSEVYLGATANGSLVLKVKLDGKTEIYYEAAFHDEEVFSKLIPIGKGMQSRYWEFSFTTKDSTKFDLSEIEFYQLDFGRKVR